jgi:pSer/pThr/pTyr-binding forkhead associated (FHA) protein
VALTIWVRSGDTESAPQLSFDAPRIVIGRGEGCEVRLPDPSVSHRHASIQQRGSDYLIVDEGSTNGTFVGQVRLSPHGPRVIRSGDLLRVGRVWLELKVETVVPTQNATLATKEIALSLVASALRAQGDPHGVTLRVNAGPDAGKTLLLTEFRRSYVIGRGKEADLQLVDDDTSRRHVEITRRGGELFVRDLGSKNGSKLAGEKLEANQEKAWPAGAELELGQTRVGYEDPTGEALLELERGPDERMAEREEVEPPAGQNPEATATSKREAPVTTTKNLPTRASRSPARTRRGWNGTDLLIIALSLLVLGVSTLGLIWLFRSN